MASAHLCLAEIHLWMLLHEVLKHVLFLLLFTRRLPLPLHLLIIHHFLDHAPRLSIQVAQLRVLRLDFRDVNLGRRCHYMRPPFGLVLFVKVYGDLFAIRSCFEGPGAFIE